MIARIWHGMVPVSKGDEYLDLMRGIALPEYLATRGNRGAWCLYRTEADVTHFEMLTFWDDTDAIKRFAGDDYCMAKYYDFDSDYLIEWRSASGTTRCTRKPRPIHYAMRSAISADAEKSLPADRYSAAAIICRDVAEAIAWLTKAFGFDHL